MVHEPEFGILIVDDESANIDVLNNILSSMYMLHTARTGLEALKAAHEKKPDLILLDVLMPGMNGFEVLTELKKSDVTRNIPVIFITELDTAEDEEKGFSLGAVDYITRPFHSSTIKARVKTHLTIVKQLRRMERFGLLDALTDIPNRRSFDIQLNVEWGRAIREKMPLSMLMADIDDFKPYNDTYGHLQGDAMLQHCAQIFVMTAKRSTDLVFRWGGEEFAVLLPNTDLNGALKVAEDIRINMEKSPVASIFGGEPTYATVSIGATSIIPSLDDSVTDFIMQADNALYTAKRTGKNRVCI